MKMTKQQVADLLLKANDDFSNVEVLYSYGWGEPVDKNIPLVLFNIADGANYRIKDNAVKEVTPALKGKWVASKFGKYLFPISGLNIEKQKLYLNGYWHDLKEFNKQWQLVED